MLGFDGNTKEVLQVLGRFTSLKEVDILPMFDATPGQSKVPLYGLTTMTYHDEIPNTLLQNLYCPDLTTLVIKRKENWDYNRQFVYAEDSAQSSAVFKAAMPILSTIDLDLGIAPFSGIAHGYVQKLLSVLPPITILKLRMHFYDLDDIDQGTLEEINTPCWEPTHFCTSNSLCTHLLALIPLTTLKILEIHSASITALGLQMIIDRNPNLKTIRIWWREQVSANHLEEIDSVASSAGAVIEMFSKGYSYEELTANPNCAS